MLSFPSTWLPCDMVRRKKDPLIQDIVEHVGEYYGTLERLVKPIVPFVLQSAASMSAYTVGLAVAQGVGSALRISCATPVLGTVGGIAGVGFASVAAGQASVMCASAYSRKPKDIDGYVRILEQTVASLNVQSMVVDVLLGVSAFKIVGGSFRAIMPSDLTKVGALAKESIPAAGMQYATDEKRRELIRMFRRDGCHHCGNKRGMVIGDHMPPNKHVIQKTEAALTQVVDRMYKNSMFRNTMGALGLRPLSDIKQRYYPQCVTCSQKQAAAVRNDRSHRVFHRVLHAGGRGSGSTAWHYVGVFVGASQDRRDRKLNALR